MIGYIEDKEFGKIKVELRRGMTSVRFAFQPDGRMVVRGPFGFPVEGILEAIERNREILRQRFSVSNVPEFHIGRVIACYKCKVVIKVQRTHPGYVLSRVSDDGAVCHVSVHENSDISSIQVKRTVSTVIGRMMAEQAKKHLLPYANEVADELGLKPARFEVGRGMRKLGHCTRTKVIQLSRNLMFMPEALIRYVICHELAHLTHMDHSPEFHALCNQYCGGKEKELEQQLRQFKFPILK